MAHSQNSNIHTLFTAFSIGRLFRNAVKQVLTSCSSVLQSDIDRLYYIRGSNVSSVSACNTLIFSVINCFFGLSFYIAGNKEAGCDTLTICALYIGRYLREIPRKIGRWRKLNTLRIMSNSGLPY